MSLFNSYLHVMPPSLISLSESERDREGEGWVGVKAATGHLFESRNNLHKYFQYNSVHLI